MDIFTYALDKHIQNSTEQTKWFSADEFVCGIQI